MPSGTRGRRGGRRAHWEVDADRLVDVVITSGPPAPLDDNAEKLKFLLNFQLVTLRRRQGLELQKLLNSKGRLAPALLEVGTDVAASLSEDLQLPLPTATPRDVFEDGGRPGKAEFLLQLDLRATSDREREDSEWEWIACEAERFRCGRDCKVTRYLVTYREALHRVNMKRKRRPAPATVQCDAPKSITPDFESLCDKLLSLPFSPMEGGSLSCVPLLKPALVQILEMLLPAELAPVLLKSIESAMPQKQDSPTTLSDPDHKNLELQQKLPVNLKSEQNSEPQEPAEAPKPWECIEFEESQVTEKRPVAHEQEPPLLQATPKILMHSGIQKPQGSILDVPSTETAVFSKMYNSVVGHGGLETVKVMERAVTEEIQEEPGKRMEMREEFEEVFGGDVGCTENDSDNLQAERELLPSWFFTFQGTKEDFAAAYHNYDDERAKEVIRLQNNLSNLETEISSKTETIKGLEKLLEKLNEVKTSQDEEGRMLQASLDSLSRCWKGLKTHVRYRKLY